MEPWLKSTTAPRSVSVEEGTLTVAGLKTALELVPEATVCSIGYGVCCGFDSCNFLEEIIKYRGNLYLRITTNVPRNSLDVDVVWRRAAVQWWKPVNHEKQIQTLKEVLVTEDANVSVFLAIQNQFSKYGPHCFVPVVAAGQSAYTSGKFENEEQVFNIVKTEFSIWGEA